MNASRDLPAPEAPRISTARFATSTAESVDARACDPVMAPAA